MVFAVGVFFTSCRDHDEELVAEMHAQIVEELNGGSGDFEGLLASVFGLGDLRSESGEVVRFGGD